MTSTLTIEALAREADALVLAVPASALAPNDMTAMRKAAAGVLTADTIARASWCAYLVADYAELAGAAPRGTARKARARFNRIERAERDVADETRKQALFAAWDARARDLPRC